MKRITVPLPFCLLLGEPAEKNRPAAHRDEHRSPVQFSPKRQRDERENERFHDRVEERCRARLAAGAMQGLEYDFIREAQVREEEESTSKEVFRRRREKRVRVLHFDERKSCDAEELVLSRMKQRVTTRAGRKNSIVRTERDVCEKRTLALLRALSEGGRRYLFLLRRRRRFRYCRR